MTITTDNPTDGRPTGYPRPATATLLVWPFADDGPPAVAEAWAAWQAAWRRYLDATSKAADARRAVKAAEAAHFAAVRADLAGGGAGTVSSTAAGKARTAADLAAVVENAAAREANRLAEAATRVVIEHAEEWRTLLAGRRADAARQLDAALAAAVAAAAGITHTHQVDRWIGRVEEQSEYGAPRTLPPPLPADLVPRLGDPVAALEAVAGWAAAKAGQAHHVEEVPS